MAARSTTKTLKSAARTALSAPERLRRALVPIAFWTGCVGVVAVLGCAVLALTPEESWPDALDPAHLPFYAVVSLCVASLVGWGCVQEGQGRVKRTIGRSPAVVVFLVLPLAAAALSFVDKHVLATPLREWPGGTWIALFVRWYTPLLVAVSLLTFLTWRARPKRRVYLTRGAGFVILVAPYVLLLAVILFDLPAPWVEDPVQDSLDTLGESSVLAQVIVGYFLGDASGD